MHAYAAEGDISVTLNGEAIALRQSPIIENGRTLVPVREVCEAMELSVDWNPDIRGITITNGDKYVKLEIDYHTIDVNGNLEYLEAAPALINDITCMPIRAVVEPFGAMVNWDNSTREVVVRVDEKDIAPTVKPEGGNGSGSASVGGSSGGGAQAPSEPVTPPGNSSGAGDNSSDEGTTVPEPEVSVPVRPSLPPIDPDGFTFYAQGGDWGFESNGRGYCWVCSYAMLFTDLLGTHVTPIDIAAYNLEMGSHSGSYMANHLGLASRFGLEFVPAIDENSAYFDRFETTHRGATYFKAETDDDVKNALIEALARNPKGIMVRFEGYPHTLIATEYKNGEIYFNDPGGLHMEDVTFENTCLASRFTLSDISFVQALVKY